MSQSASPRPCWCFDARCHGEETLSLMVPKSQPERIATTRRMAALPSSGVRPDQVTAIAQAFEKLMP